jgi:hypothetical protein
MSDPTCCSGWAPKEGSPSSSHTPVSVRNTTAHSTAGHGAARLLLGLDMRHRLG